MKAEEMSVLRRLFGGLRGRIFFSLLLVSGLAALVVGAASYYSARSAVRKQVSQNLSNVAGGVRDIIERVWVPTLTRQMQVLAEVSGRLYAGLSGGGNIRAVLGEERVKVPGFKRVSFYTADGVFLASTEPGYRGESVPQLSGLRAGQTALVPFRMVGSGEDAEPLMTVGAPVVVGGETVAVIAGDLTPEGIGQELATLTVGTSGEIYMVDGEGRLLTLPRGGGEAGLEVMGEPLGTEGVRRAVRGESGVAEYVTYDGRRVLGSFSYLPQYGWGLIVEEDASEAFAGLITLRNYVLLVLLGLAFASLLASLVLARLLARPLLRLKEGVERLGLGELDYRVEVRGSEEMRSLATSFNRMADAVQVSREAMEERVRERTAELQTLNSMAASLRRMVDPQEILRRALETCMEFAGYEMGWCYLMAEDGLTLRYMRCQPEMAGELPETITPGKGEWGRILARKKAVFVSASGESPPPGLRGLLSEGAFAILPLCSPARTVGLLCLGSPGRGSLSPEARRTLEAIADEVGIALDNAILYRELREYVEELERANRELRGVDEMKSNFISAVTHELKQPLSLIGGYAQTLYDYYDSLTYEEEMQALRVILERTRFLTSLVDDLLDLSLLEVGHIKLHKEEFDLVELCSRLAEEYGDRGEGQPIVVDFPPDFPRLVADARRMEQVLSNLLSNAVKFSEGRGEIRICGEVSGDTARIRVMDQGVGIDPVQMPRIFDRFYQADASTRRQYPGVGLGLFICRQLVEAHGGRIWAENRPEGGAMFTFEIPLSTERGGE